MCLDFKLSYEADERKRVTSTDLINCQNPKLFSIVSRFQHLIHQNAPNKIQIWVPVNIFQDWRSNTEARRSRSLLYVNFTNLAIFLTDFRGK